jgi:hypothetical protein
MLDGFGDAPYSEVVRNARGKQFRAWLMLATFVASLASAQLSADHLDVLDIACGEVGLSLESEGARLASSPTQSDAQHCVVCHFLRVARGANATSAARLFVEDGLAVEFAGVHRIPTVVDSITRPSRGPPAASLTSLL